MVNHKQRYHQTTHLKAESVTEISEPRHMFTGPSLPCSYVETEREREGEKLIEGV